MEKMFDTIGFIAIIVIAIALTVLCGIIIFGDNNDSIMDKLDEIEDAQLQNNMRNWDNWNELGEYLERKDEEKELNCKYITGTIIGNNYLLTEKGELLEVEVTYGAEYDGSNTQTGILYVSDDSNILVNLGR